MAIFRQRFVIESPFPVDEARKKLLAVVKTDLPPCAKCGQMLLPATRTEARTRPGCEPARPSIATLACGAPSPPGNGSSSKATSRCEDFRSAASSPIAIRAFRSSQGDSNPPAPGTRIVIEMKMHPLGWVLLVGGMGLSFIVPGFSRVWVVRPGIGLPRVRYRGLRRFHALFQLVLFPRNIHVEPFVAATATERRPAKLVHDGVEETLISGRTHVPSETPRATHHVIRLVRHTRGL